jgi:hypothetical protein
MEVMEVWENITDYKNYQVSNQGRVRNKKTGRVLKASPQNMGYSQVSLYIEGQVKRLLVSRLVALGFVDNDNPDYKVYVDHKNGDKTDNRAVNLRWCTPSQNTMNRKKKRDSLSRFKGVTFHTKANKWVASISNDGVQTHLGCFDDEEEAAEAYIDAAREYHGEFALEYRDD